LEGCGSIDQIVLDVREMPDQEDLEDGTHDAVPVLLSEVVASMGYSKVFMILSDEGDPDVVPGGLFEVRMVSV
jgi:hypothetical protein